MSRDYNTITHRAVIRVSDHELDLWEDMMSSGDVDYASNDFPEDSCVWCKTAEFDDCMEMDIKVCTSSVEDRDLWSEAVLFTPCGGTISHTEVCDSLRGEWTIEVLDHGGNGIVRHVYIATVEGLSGHQKR